MNSNNKFCPQILKIVQEVSISKKKKFLQMNSHFIVRDTILSLTVNFKPIGQLTRYHHSTWDWMKIFRLIEE